MVLPLVYGGLKELTQPWVSGARPSKMCFFSLKDVAVERHAGMDS